MQSSMPGAAAGATLLALRAATSELHHVVEQRLAWDRPIDLPYYLSVLRGFDAFLQVWEPLVARSAPVRLRPWVEQGMRHADLRRDLQALGHEPAAAARMSLPLETRAAAMGSLYVMEGSALGARVIAPRIREALGLHRENGASYFDRDVAAASLRWKDFRFLLEQEVASPAARHHACSGAAATFRALLGMFQGSRDVAALA